MYRISVLFPAFLHLLGCASSQPKESKAPPQAAESRFSGLAQSFYERDMANRPHEAVDQGRHEHDGELPDVSGPALERTRSWLEEQQAVFEGVAPAGLNKIERLEREAILAEIREMRFSLEHAGAPYRNPMFYMGALSLSPYISRDYTDKAERTKAIISAAKQVPAYLANAQKNLEQKIPITWLETALLQTKGMITFVGEGGDVRTAMAGLSQVETESLHGALDEMVAALEHYARVLEARKSEATNDFALGESLFLKMLEDTQGVKVDLATLEQVAEKDLARNLAAIEKAARQIDKKKSVREIVLAVMNEKPAADAVLQAATDQAAHLRKFIEEKAIVSIPTDDIAKVVETPPFLRWNFAFLDAAGPFESRPLPSFYYITPPDPEWPKEKQREYIPGTADLLFVTVHEVWPGHFLHSLHGKQNPSAILKSYSNYAMTEGWAHYAEEMVVAEGLGDGDPKTHIGQLMNALLRNVRFVSTIGLHAKGMTVEQSEKLFKEKAFQDDANAKQQAVRGTFDPMYLAYTLGKLMILKLREDYANKLGAEFSLQRFHDDFLSHGRPPVPVIRAEMLGADAGSPF